MKSLLSKCSAAERRQNLAPRVSVEFSLGGADSTPWHRRGGRAIKENSRSNERRGRGGSFKLQNNCFWNQPPRLRRTRWLRSIFLMAQPPLLCQGGGSASLTPLRGSILGILLLILSVPPLPGQTRAALPQYVSDTDGTTFEQLTEIMFTRNKDLQAAREDLRRAQARLTQSGLRPNPTLDFSRSTDTLFGREGEGSYGIGLSQPFELGGKRSKRSRVAEISVDVVKAQMADAESQLRSQLHSLFVEALSAAARVDLFAEIQNVNEQMSRIMEVSLRAGDASRLDATLLRASLNRAIAQAVQAESELSGTMLQIKTLAGIAPDERLVLRRVGQLEPRDLSREAALQLALDNRPDLRAARLRESRDEASIALARAQAVPDVSASLRFDKENRVSEGSLRPEEKFVDHAKLLSFGLSLPLPFFNRQQGNISEAISLQSQARAQREALEQRVRRDVLLAFERYDFARRAMDVLNRGVITENQESFQIVKLSYDLGELRLVDLLNQQRVLIDTQMSYLEVQRDSMLALVDLERAIGSAGLF